MDDSRLTELIKGERWDRVVLQEHSQTISRPQDRRARTVPAAIALDGMARRSGAKTVLFTNSGYERGDQDAVVGDTYPAMQARLGQGYAELASTLSAMQAPVGLAWEEALREHPGLDLWGDDGIRPSLTGSYLTACVFYAWLTRRDPAGNGYTAGLQPAKAQLLQRVAGESVRRIDPGALPRER